MTSITTNFGMSFSLSPRPVLGKWVCRMPTIYEDDSVEQWSTAEIDRQFCVQMEVILQHRLWSYVMECTLGSCDEARQDMLVTALLGDCKLMSLACSQFGGLVVGRLADLPTIRDIVKQLLAAGQLALEASRFGKRVLEAFNLTAAVAIDSC